MVAVHASRQVDRQEIGKGAQGPPGRDRTTHRSREARRTVRTKQNEVRCGHLGCGLRICLGLQYATDYPASRWKDEKSGVNINKIAELTYQLEAMAIDEVKNAQKPTAARHSDCRLFRASDELNDIVCDVEVINAVALDQGKDLSDEEIGEVNSMVLQIEKLVSTELSSIKVDEED